MTPAGFRPLVLPVKWACCPLVGMCENFSTGNAATKFVQIDYYVVRRLQRLMVKRYGRNLRPGQVRTWTREWFEAHGLYRLRGTIRYPGYAS